MRYNGRNQPDTITDPASIEVSFDYDNGGRRTRITRPASYIDYGYNARNWITSVHNRLTNGTTLYDADYYFSDGALWDHTGNPLKRVENYGGDDYTTTLRYDDVYRETEETKRDDQSNVLSSLLYGYDEVGNRISETRDGQELTFTYDDNNKLTYVEAESPTASATMAYDNAGNMTSVTGDLYQNKTIVYNDENKPTSIAYGGVTDLYTYNWEGQRTRTRLDGVYRRHLYNGQRVLQDLTDGGDWHTTYTTEDGSYNGMLLAINRYDLGNERFPMYDNIGTAVGLVCELGTVTDSYALDTFGTTSGPAQGSTPNPYRYGAAWGYITDPSGLLQLGARFYWPEVGRFVSQDPARDDMNSYAYTGDRPTVGVDPDGERVTLRTSTDWRAVRRCIRDSLNPMTARTPGSIDTLDKCFRCGVAVVIGMRLGGIHGAFVVGALNPRCWDCVASIIVTVANCVRQNTSYRPSPPMRRPPRDPYLPGIGTIPRRVFFGG